MSSYDAIGNIQTKTGIAGTYAYGSRPHAVTSADGTTYAYDSCGNMLGRSKNGTNVSSTAWTSFNKVSTLYNGNDGSEFTHGIGNQRIVQVSFKDGDGTKKLYLGGFEQTEELTGGTQYDRANWQWTHTETRVFVATPSGVIGIHVQDAAEIVTRKYLHKDHLGSIVAVTGAGSGGSASILAEYSYDSWGKRRSADTWLAATVDTSSLETDRGFTGHEMLDNVGLVHMNGRIYDSNLGRFLSADPIVQAPGDLQSYNRYSYVRNNPLSLTDPSGFSWWSKNVTRKVSDFSKKYWKTIVTVVVAVTVTATVGALTMGAGPIISGTVAGFAGGFTAGFTGSALHGGSFREAHEAALKGGLWGGVAGALSGLIGHFGAPYETWKFIKIAQWSAHGVKGGVVSLGQGDSFDSGFISGGLSSMAGNDIILASVAGGTASELTGGKFMNGAVTGAAGAAAASALSGGFTIQRSLKLLKTGWEVTRNTLVGTPAELATMDWRPWSWKAYRHVGGKRVNGNDLGQKRAGKYLPRNQVGQGGNMNKVDGGWLFGGAASHDQRFSVDNQFGPIRTVFDIMLAVDAMTSVVPTFGFGGNATPIIPAAMTGAGMLIAAPIHFLGINP